VGGAVLLWPALDDGVRLRFRRAGLHGPARADRRPPRVLPRLLRKVELRGGLLSQVARCGRGAIRRRGPLRDHTRADEGPDSGEDRRPALKRTLSARAAASLADSRTGTPRVRPNELYPQEPGRIGSFLYTGEV